MDTSFKTFIHALNHPQPRTQVLIGYLLIALCIAAVYQTPQLIDPIAALGVPEHLAPLPILVTGAFLLAWPFRNLRTVHCWFSGKTLYSDAEYMAMAKVGKGLALGASLGKWFLEFKKISILGIGLALLAAWLW